MPYQLNLTKSNVFFVKSNYQEQILALEQVLPIIKKTIRDMFPSESIAFGGGTALAMYYLGHRKSFDIDLFVNDIQYLNFFSPKLWILENPNFNDDHIDLAHQISFYTKDGIKIDILPIPFIRKPLLDDSKAIFSQNLYIHSIEDIIANKIHFRKTDNKTRDIFDIVASIEKYPNLLEKLLETEFISKKDLSELKTALNNLDYEKYSNEISIIQPTQNYKEISKNSPKILINHIDRIILQTHKTKTHQISTVVIKKNRRR